MLIGEVSRRSGVSARMLRHYDQLGLVSPTGRTTGGYREYSADDIRRLFHVESLRTLGMTLSDTKRALDDPDFTPDTLMGELVEHTRARIAAETELLDTLERVEAAGPAQWDEVLHTVALLRALESESTGHRQQAVLAHEGAALPVQALAEAALSEENLNVAGALQWSLARAGDAALAELEPGLDSPDADVRRRAVVAIAALPGEAASTLLGTALTDPDTTVRDRATLTLGGRHLPEAIPALLEMITAGRSDVEAAETLGLLAENPDLGTEIVRAVRTELDDSTDAATRLRLTQALAEIPDTTADLTTLTGDADPVVAGTATAILRLRTRREARN
ncbi:MerR family transcriptional regulator [Nocardia vermiculata]|uniref:MerR family transcriptional regulator n=1 Tax=Nocardia vermiculata TaxID=257274 RepID=A0A846Y8P4_9NOCA|nr:MerR family transcriptional regulator [Nocardia vermiculata]NKY54222.1 MerR family transcriptional regulator [Nocardia vermiculata]